MTKFDDGTVYEVSSMFDDPAPSRTAIALAPIVTSHTEIAISTPLSVSDRDIDSIGEDSVSGMSSISQKMMSSVKASDADVLGSKLNELVVTAKGLDPTKMSKGLVSKVMGFFTNAKESMISQYNTVEAQMDRLMAELDKTVSLHKARYDDFEQLYQENYRYHQGLESDVEKAEGYVVALKSQLESLGASDDAFAAQNIADCKDRIERLEKIVDDLKRAMLLSKMAAPKIRLLESNGRALVSKFNNIQMVTVPAWKQAFTLYLMQLEQKKAAELANSIDDATDEAINASANLLRQGTVEIAKAKQRSVVSIETLQNVQAQLLGSFDDVEKINEEAKQGRAEAAKIMDSMEAELIQRFSKK